MNRKDKFFIQSKAHWLRQMAQDLKKDFGIPVAPGAGFNREKYVYFITLGRKKYVHKKAFEFLALEGGTYESFISRQHEPEEADIIKKEHISNHQKIINFLREENKNCVLYPRFLGESEEFLVFRSYEDGYEVLTDLKKTDFMYIKKHYKIERKKGMVTPFFQNLYARILRHKETGEIIIDDLTAFDVVDVDDKLDLLVLFRGEKSSKIYKAGIPFLYRANNVYRQFEKRGYFCRDSQIVSYY